MRAYRQWVLWRLEARPGAKPTKIPYQLNGAKADVTRPETWCSFDEAVAACPNPDYTTLDPKGFSGIGFVLTKADPFGFIDLDDCHDDISSYERQIKIYREFDSYSEKSPSGTGLHIIVKGKVPQGRRRSNIEIYSDERYMTMTGDVYNDRQITDRHALLNILFDEMGAPPTLHSYGEDQAEKQTDEVIYNIAREAANGEKFCHLFEGAWDRYYPSQSEADYALIDILAFYTQNRTQISRIFRSSVLGERTKAKRANYVNFMIEKSFDRQLPPIDIDGLRIKGEMLLKQTSLDEPGGTPRLAGALQDAPSTPCDAPQEARVSFPPGLVGEIATFLLAAAPRPVPMIALAGAIGFLAGITGRAYNFNGTGLNQYVLCIAETGTGKEAISSGISRIMGLIKPTIPASAEFIGPGQIASYQGITKWLIKTPSIISIIGEFGKKLKGMSNDRASPHLAGILTFMLEIFTKSGKGQVFDPSAYADVAKNTGSIYSPNFSVIGETTPGTFYDVLDEQMITDGLLPRFTIFEYLGKAPYLSKTYIDAKPSFVMLDKLTAIMAQCLAAQQSNLICEVTAEPEAQAMLDAFDRYLTDKRNDTKSQITQHLWTRAHIKAQRLAALIAVGVNYLNPVVTVDLVVWATNLVTAQTESLIKKFDGGETGLTNNTGLEDYKQIKDCVAVLKEWFLLGSKSGLSYKMTKEMQAEYCFVGSGLQIKMFSMPSFKKDRYGPTVALKKTLQHFIDAGDIAELSKEQARSRYGTIAKIYCITNIERFMA